MLKITNPKRENMFTGQFDFSMNDDQDGMSGQDKRMSGQDIKRSYNEVSLGESDIMIT